MKALIFCSVIAVLFGTAALLNGDATDNRGAEAEQKAVAAVAEQAYKATKAAYDAGPVQNAEAIYLWSRRWMESEIESAANEKARHDARQAHRDRMQELSKGVTVKFNVGAVDGEVEKKYAADFYLAEAQLWLKK